MPVRRTSESMVKRGAIQSPFRLRSAIRIRRLGAFPGESSVASHGGYGHRNQVPVTYTKNFLTVVIALTIVIDNFAGTYTVLWIHIKPSDKSRGVLQRLEGRNEVTEGYQDEPPIAGMAGISPLRAWSNSASRYRDNSWNRDRLHGRQCCECARDYH